MNVDVNSTGRGNPTPACGGIDEELSSLNLAEDTGDIQYTFLNPAYNNAAMTTIASRQGTRRMVRPLKTPKDTVGNPCGIPSAPNKQYVTYDIAKYLAGYGESCSAPESAVDEGVDARCKAIPLTGTNYTGDEGTDRRLSCEGTADGCVYKGSNSYIQSQAYQDIIGHQTDNNQEITVGLSPGNCMPSTGSPTPTVEDCKRRLQDGGVVDDVSSGSNTPQEICEGDGGCKYVNLADMGTCENRPDWPPPESSGSPACGDRVRTRLESYISTGNWPANVEEDLITWCENMNGAGSQGSDNDCKITPSPNNHISQDKIYQDASALGIRNFNSNETEQWANLLTFMKHGPDKDGLTVLNQDGLPAAPCIPAHTDEADELGLENCPQDSNICGYENEQGIPLTRGELTYCCSGQAEMYADRSFGDLATDSDFVVDAFQSVFGGEEMEVATPNTGNGRLCVNHFWDYDPYKRPGKMRSNTVNSGGHTGGVAPCANCGEWEDCNYGEPYSGNQHCTNPDHGIRMATTWSEDYINVYESDQLLYKIITENDYCSQIAGGIGTGDNIPLEGNEGGMQRCREDERCVWWEDRWADKDIAGDGLGTPADAWGRIAEGTEYANLAPGQQRNYPLSLSARMRMDYINSRPPGSGHGTLNFGCRDGDTDCLNDPETMTGLQGTAADGTAVGFAETIRGHQFNENKPCTGDVCPMGNPSPGTSGEWLRSAGSDGWRRHNKYNSFTGGDSGDKFGRGGSSRVLQLPGLAREQSMTESEPGWTMGGGCHSKAPSSWINGSGLPGNDPPHGAIRVCHQVDPISHQYHRAGTWATDAVHASPVEPRCSIVPTTPVPPWGG